MDCLLVARWDMHPIAPIATITLFFLNGFVGNWLGTYESLSFYISIALCLLILLSLHKRRELMFVPRDVDRLLGDLSYPIYLIHAPLAWLLLYLCKLANIPITGPSIYALLLFVGPVLIASWLLSIAIERPIESLRTKVKQAI